MAVIALPGLIDPHVHLRTPGQEEKEDFLTGSRAALAGGFTTLIDMPNNKLPITSKVRLEQKIKIAKKQIVCDLGMYFGSQGDNLKEFSKVENKVLGLKIYLNETTGNFLIPRDQLEDIFINWTKAKPILFHAEDDAVSLVIDLTRKHKRPVHFCHISTASDLKQIMLAKQENLPVTCGVTPHHLFLSDKEGGKLGPFGLMKPPLRSKTDVDFLWQHLSSIDCVESDHAPHTIREKKAAKVPFGVPNLETTLPLLLTAMAEKKLLLEDIVRLCHINPARIFHLKSEKETKIEVDLSETYTINNKDLFTKCGWSPYHGWKVKGKVKTVWIRGTKVFENGKILVKPGWGKIITSHN